MSYDSFSERQGFRVYRDLVYLLALLADLFVDSGTLHLLFTNRYIVRYRAIDLLFDVLTTFLVQPS